MFSSKDIFFGSQASGYRISNSLRFRSSASAYLSRTLGTPTDSKKWTLSCWVKRGALTGYQSILGSGQAASATNYAQLYFDTSTNSLIYYDSQSSATAANYTTAAVFRDPSAWYHLTVTVDTTATTKLQIFVNGVLQTLTTSTAYSLNATTSINTNAYRGAVGATSLNSGYSNCFDGYLAEVNFIDGQALTPSSFGETDATTGVWKPKAYTGTYGTNGFYLKFADNSALTTASNVGLGKDSSPNGNYWVTNNISITAGATYDSMIDTPTPYDDGGNGVGNYCVLNYADKGTSATITGANLDYTASASGTIGKGSIGVSSGKWYWEINILSTANWVGICSASESPNITYLGATATSYTYAGGNGNKYNNGTYSAYGSTFTTGDVICVALDMDNSAVYFGKQAGGTGSITWQNSGVPTSGSSKTGAAFTALPTTIVPALGNNSASNCSINFGQRPFSATPPSGFKPLNTFNLPTPTIAAGGNYMAAVLYNGTSASNTVVATSSNSGNNPLALTFQPDFVWIKSRSAATDHKLTDAVRGVTKALISDTTGAETTDTNGLTAFTSTGFTVGSDSVYNNGTGPATYVAWEWKANGSGSSNTSGSITSTVSANATAGFSVVTYTGNGTAGATVGHGLGVAPSFIIVKNRGVAAHDWECYHASLGNTYRIRLNLTSVADTGGTMWNNTSPTSAVFSVGSDQDVNYSTNTYVAYCFAAVAGYSAFGSYTGNGSADGPFVFTGFRPRYVLVKRTDSTSDWYIWDTARDTYNVISATLFADTAGAETSAASIDGLSNGFKCRSATVVNVSTGTYIYAAFAENPFKYARAR
jgi:SPRY domain